MTIASLEGVACGWKRGKSCEHNVNLNEWCKDFTEQRRHWKGTMRGSDKDSFPLLNKDEAADLPVKM
jgi:hypothetical protein